MGFRRRLGLAFIQYGLVATAITGLLLAGVLGYSTDDIRDEVAPYMGDAPPEQYEIDSLAVIEFELVLVFTPLLITVYRFFRYDHVGVIGETILFLFAGNNPVLGVLGIPLYAAAVNSTDDDASDED